MSKIKVISGGQTGVDQAALEAAKWAGFPTGGTAPQRPAPTIEEVYNSFTHQMGHPGSLDAAMLEWYRRNH